MRREQIAVEHDDEPCPCCGDTARQSNSCAQSVTIEQLRVLTAARFGAPPAATEEP